MKKPTKLINHRAVRLELKTAMKEWGQRENKNIPKRIFQQIESILKKEIYTIAGGI